MLGNAAKKIAIYVVIMFIISGCQNEGKQWTTPDVFQDTHILKDDNGKIVSIKKQNLQTRYNSIEIYRINYLSDGLKIVGFVLKHNDDKKRPVIIFNRGGNREFSKITDSTLKFLSYLASKGYVVVASQYRGNDGGEGQEEFGGRDVDDVLNLMPMIRSLSFADENRTAMLGFSRGGMMTYLALKAQMKVKVAAVIGGVTDIESLSHRSDGMKKVITDLVGDDKNEWKKRSAIYWADKINVPLLILHGSEDWRVDPEQAIHLAEKLEQYDKVYDFKLIEGGDHSLSNRSEIKYKYIFDWFDTYLNQ